MKIFLSAFATFFLIHFTTFSQKKNVSIEDIWKNYSFYARQSGEIRSLKDGLHYTELERTEDGYELTKYSYLKPDFSEVIVKESELKKLNNRGRSYFQNDDRNSARFSFELRSLK